MNIIFAGTPVFAERHLHALINSEHRVCAVYSQPDRPAGRGKKLLSSPVKQLALEHNIPVFQPLSLKDESAQHTFFRLVDEHHIDVMVVVAYGLILPKLILDTPRLGCMNVHGSILPRWRGAAPIQRAIEAGDTESGVTIMQMDVGLDTGDMLLKATCPLSTSDTSASLHDKLTDIGPPALLRTLTMLNEGSASPEKQNDELANYAAKIEKAEAQINWQLDADTLDRQIRAFNPFPICFTQLNGERVKIHTAKIVDSGTHLSAGELCIDSGRLIVGTGSKNLEIITLQLPGKKAMASKDYLNGIGHTLPAAYFDGSDSNA